MDVYKPNFMGRVMPVDNMERMLDFMINKFSAFSAIYDACKPLSQQINTVVAVESTPTAPPTMFSIKVVADQDTIRAISSKDVTINGNIISADMK